MLTNLAPGPRSLHQGEMTTIGWHSYYHMVLGCVLFEPVPCRRRVVCLSVSLCMPDIEDVMPMTRSRTPIKRLHRTVHSWLQGMLFTAWANEWVCTCMQQQRLMLDGLSQQGIIDKWLLWQHTNISRLKQSPGESAYDLQLLTAEHSFWCSRLQMHRRMLRQQGL